MGLFFFLNFLFSFFIFNEFVNKIADPEKCVEWWEDLFINLSKNHKSITKNSSKFKFIEFTFSLFLRIIEP